MYVCMLDYPSLLDIICLLCNMCNCVTQIVVLIDKHMKAEHEYNLCTD